MGILNIREAVREGARLVIGLGGISGSGKTFTALQLAWGLAGGNSKKVGLLCTENGRGRLYANALKDRAGKVHPFMIADLYAPFSPARYTQAILEFQEAGVEVLIIDSVSHEWEGLGGCEEIATVGDPKTPRWNKAKGEHKKFMNAMLASNCHVIACMRARPKVKPVQRGDKMVFEDQGILPIQEKNFTFELTASLMMWNEGKEQQVLKCPEELRAILGREQGYITAKDGLALRKWVDGGAQLDPEVEATRNTLRTVCEQGMAALESAWLKLKPAQKAALGDPFLDELKASAASFDAHRALAASGEGAKVDDLNASVLGDTAQAPAETAEA